MDDETEDAAAEERDADETNDETEDERELAARSSPAGSPARSGSSTAVIPRNGVTADSVPAPDAIDGGRSPRSMTCPFPSATARSTQFSSSRTLPGHSYCISAFMAALATCNSCAGA